MDKELKFDAIVLSAVDYKEYDKLLTIFSSEYGRQVVLLKGCKRPKAKLRFAGQPFFFGEFMVVKGKGYDVVTQVSPKRSFMSVTTDYDCYVDACMALKTIDISCLSQKSERLFLLLITYLVVLEQHLDLHSLITCKFYIELIKLLGFEINTDNCQECGQILQDNVYYNINHNCIICDNCKKYDSIPMRNEILKLIRILKANKFLSLLDKNLDSADIEAVKTLVLKAIERISK